VVLAAGKKKISGPGPSASPNIFLRLRFFPVRTLCRHGLQFVTLPSHLRLWNGCTRKGPLCFTVKNRASFPTCSLLGITHGNGRTVLACYIDTPPHRPPGRRPDHGPVPDRAYMMSRKVVENWWFWITGEFWSSASMFTNTVSDLFLYAFSGHVHYGMREWHGQQEKTAPAQRCSRL